ncbi:MAG: HEAT repeat domain-containing protein [Candidatus Poribacteria bacterium]|nr:HEAT repeat domain-containing protein [Candidatus Poribacteria bacterium]
MENCVFKLIRNLLLIYLLVLASCWQEPEIKSLIQDLGRKTPVFMGSTPRSRAIHDLQEIGEGAIPELIKALEDKNPEVCTGATIALSKIGYNVVPFLIQALQNPSVKSLALDTFVLIGKGALPDLIETLEDNRSDLRSAAAEVLGRIGSEDPETIMVLWKLENSTRKFLTSNRQAFGQTNPTESARALENIIPALTEALQDSVPKVRANAADSLVRIGTPEAIESVLPVLKQALWSEDPVTRANVANTLIAIGTPEAVEPVLMLLRQSLKNNNPSVRSNAAKLLEKIGTPKALKILQEDTGG